MTGRDLKAIADLIDDETVIKFVTTNGTPFTVTRGEVNQTTTFPTERGELTPIVVDKNVTITIEEAT